MLGRGEAPTRGTESLPDTPFARLPHGVPQKGVPTLIHTRVRPPGTLNPGGTFHAGITLHLGVPTLIHKRVRPPGTLHAGISPLAHFTWGFPLVHSLSACATCRASPWNAPPRGPHPGTLHTGDLPPLWHTALGGPHPDIQEGETPWDTPPRWYIPRRHSPHLGDHSKREVSLSVCSTWEVSSLAHPTRNRVPLGHSMWHTPLGGLPHGMFHNGGSSSLHTTCKTEIPGSPFGTLHLVWGDPPFLAHSTRNCASLSHSTEG